MKKPLFPRICIVGIGLIGGSLGMALKKRRLARWVVGVSRTDATAKCAVATKAADVVTKNLKEGVTGADLVVLAAPVSTIVRQLREIAPFLKKGAVVIDVGGSKVQIESAAKKALKKNAFVGCHPMAGSQHTGVENASPDLFEGSVCFLTRPDVRVAKLWRAVGSQPMFLSAVAHDQWVARASHLPHVLAFALFQSFDGGRRVPANPSIRDLARLSKSDAGLWSDVLLSNRGPVAAALARFRANLATWHKALTRNDRSRLSILIREANRRSLSAFPEA